MAAGLKSTMKISSGIRDQTWKYSATHYVTLGKLPNASISVTSFIKQGGNNKPQNN